MVRPGCLPNGRQADTGQIAHAAFSLALGTRAADLRFRACRHGDILGLFLQPADELLEARGNAVAQRRDAQRRQRLSIGAEHRHAHCAHPVDEEVQHQRVAAFAGALDLLLDEAHGQLRVAGQTRLDQRQDGRDLFIRRPRQQGEAARADTQRTPAADVEIVGADRKVADLPVHAHRLHAGADGHQHAVARLRRQPDQRRAHVPAQVIRPRERRRDHISFFSQRPGLVGVVAADVALLREDLEDAQRRGFVDAGCRRDLGEPAGVGSRKRAQDAARLLHRVGRRGARRHARVLRR